MDKIDDFQNYCCPTKLPANFFIDNLRDFEQEKIVIKTYNYQLNKAFENISITFFNSDTKLPDFASNITIFFSKIHLAVSLKEQELFPHPTYHRRHPTLDENSTQAKPTKQLWVWSSTLSIKNIRSPYI